MADSTAKFPRPPRGLQISGRRLWRSIVAELELEEWEAGLLGEACRVQDRLDGLEAVLERDGTVLPDGRPHPCLTEARQQQLAMARLFATLRLPQGMEDDLNRPQRRGSARRPYQLRNEA